MSSEEKEAVKKARFVATTVSKAVVDRVVRDCEFDVVIFDEASMAYIPQIVFAASLAKNILSVWATSTASSYRAE